MTALVFDEARLSAASAEGDRLFRPGDHWLAVGDSITQHGGYGVCLLLYYATRFPDRVLEPANAGVAGDSAAGALKRYAWDIAAQGATTATVMFGMNDVGQALYGDIPVTPDLEQKRRAALDRYAQNTTELAGRLRRDGIRVTLLTPTPYDETSASDRPRLTGINAALGECAGIARRIATEQDCALIDFHGPMTALNARLQAANPALSVIGPDRMHPGAPGHLLMAYLILKGQGAPALVSAIDIDVSGSRKNTAENAELGEVRATPEGVEFTAEEKALPYPIPNDAGAVAGWVPFQEELNRETLRVTGLAPGLHALSIDGVEIRRYPAETLATGVNLALESGTPQMRQAFRVADQVRRWQRRMSQGVRLLALVEYWHLSALPRPVDFDAARLLLEAKLERANSGAITLDAYTREIIANYLKFKPAEPNIKAELAELLKRIRLEARPTRHTYQIKPVAPAVI